jgi:hypothetical protein
MLTEIRLPGIPAVGSLAASGRLAIFEKRGDRESAHMQAVGERMRRLPSDFVAGIQATFLFECVRLESAGMLLAYYSFMKCSMSPKVQEGKAEAPASAICRRST